MLNNVDAVGSPDWWLMRLGWRLRDRRALLGAWWAYYSGDHPLPQGPRRATETFRDFQKRARSNFCREIVNASVDRLRIIGVADEEGQPDDQAWAWWQANKMDGRQSSLWRTVLALGEAYVIVGAHPRTGEPLATIEHPREVITEDDPATGDRAAGLKVWYDDIARAHRAIVFLPDGIVRYVSDQRGPGPAPWGPGAWTLEDAEAHRLQRVPVVPFSCRPFVGERPEPEFAPVIDVQDRINLGLLNRMTAERYSAFRQKWVRGHKFKVTKDPITGLDTVEQPFIPDPGAVWGTSGENAQFGEFSQTQLGDYMRAHETDIRDLLVISRTPAYTYAGDLVNISADTVAALDATHVAKVEEHQAHLGEQVEDMLGLMAEVAGVGRDYESAEVRWRDPRTINPAVAADAATKKKAIGYPLAVLAEDLGESPQRIRRITSEAAADALLASLSAPPTTPAAGLAAASPGGDQGPAAGSPPAVPATG